MDFHDRRDGSVKPPHVIEREERARKLEASKHKLVSSGKGVVHITDIDPRGNYGPNAGNDTGKGYVSYAPENHCAGLTRIGSFRATRAGYNDLGEAVKGVESGVFGKPCKTCLTAAKANL